MNTALLQFVRRVYFLSNRVVEYRPRETVCPVCEYLQMVDRNSVKVLKTVGEIRYCECMKCGSHFRAYKKLEKVQKICRNKKDSVMLKSKAGKKNNDNKLARNGIGSDKQRNRSNTRRRTELSD